MTSYSRSYGRFGRRFDPGTPRPAERLLDYLRSRSLETWLFFAAGLALGLFVG